MNEFALMILVFKEYRLDEAIKLFLNWIMDVKNGLKLTKGPRN